MRNRKFLILSSKSDVHADAVAWGLEQLGIESSLLSFERFPVELRLSLRLGDGASIVGAVDTPIRTDENWLIWRRRVMPPRLDPRLHPSDIDAAKLEAKDFVGGLLHAMGGESFEWINDNASAWHASSKSWQLQMASSVGFRTPRTLISNDPAAIRSFFSELGSSMVSKSFYPRMWWSEEQGKTFTAVTSLLRSLDGITDSSLAICPTIYQEPIPKLFEVRVTYFLGRMSAVRIDSQSRRKTVDWRHDIDDGKPWPLLPLALPQQVEQMIDRLMQSMKLKFGCLDFIVTPDQEYVFLEVNEQGQFLWVEEQLPSQRLLAWFCDGVREALGHPTTEHIERISMERYLATGRHRSIRQAMEIEAKRKDPETGFVSKE